jgi:UDP-glucose 4-epimerase
VLTRPGGPAVAVFGMGLLGTAVVADLTRRHAWEKRELPFPWEAGPAQVEAVAGIEAFMAGASANDLRVVWAAGRAGFGATDAEVDRELESFKAVLALAERLVDRRANAAVGFHLLSSAGGLFEGQREVGAETKPLPRRPYARLKLQQEELLAAAGERLVRRVYRVSSVYGLPRGRQRLGLIPTLVGNGLRHRVSTLVGRATTLRDFVWAGDVGRFVAADLGATAAGLVIHLLAAGRSATLLEVQRLIEAAIGRRLYVTYAADPSNAADVTFSPRALPAGWEPLDLGCGVRLVCHDAVGRVG